jgi:hypothetical protein
VEALIIKPVYVTMKIPIRMKVITSVMGSDSRGGQIHRTVVRRELILFLLKKPISTEPNRF